MCQCAESIRNHHCTGPFYNFWLQIYQDFKSYEPLQARALCNMLKLFWEVDTYWSPSSSIQKKWIVIVEDSEHFLHKSTKLWYTLQYNKQQLRN